MTGDLGICVLKEYWGKGIGSQMLGKIIEFAKENSFEIIELQVRSDNAAAIHLYEKLNLKYPAFFKIGDTFINFDFMYLSL